MMRSTLAALALALVAVVGGHLLDGGKLGTLLHGTALLIVEQQVTHALGLCDRAILLDHGSVVWEGTPEDAGDLVATRIFDTG